MRMPTRVANPALAVLIRDSGFSSLERFADAVNLRGWQMYGIKLCYDHVRVKRWVAGSVCQHGDVVAAVLSDAWGVPVPLAVLWPRLREGAGPVPAHLQPWVAARTLEDLGVFLRSDMLTRRELLADSVGVATGAALVDPIARWLGGEAWGLAPGEGGGPWQVGMGTVVGIEQATRLFAAADAQGGGELSREAAVGQLRYAVDLAAQGSYSHAVGDRLLAATAELSAVAGWMCHDVGMEGPAQRYLVYGLQAARESGDERAPLLAVGILADMARQMRSLGHPDTGLRLVNLAFEQLPNDRHRNAVRAMLWSLRARMLAGMGISYLPEMRSAVGLSFELYSDAPDEDIADSIAASPVFAHTSDAELASSAAWCYNDLAEEEPRLAADAEQQALYALTHRGDGFTRAKVFNQIALAQARFRGAEPDQACSDGHQAIEMAADVTASQRVTSRLAELMTDSEPYQDRPAVRDLRERLTLVG